MMTGREVICLFLLFAVALGITDPQPLDEHKSVEIEDTTVTLICPVRDPKWEKEGKAAEGETTENKLIIKDYKEKHNGLYSCTTNLTEHEKSTADAAEQKKHYFYTKLKVCKGCKEFDVSWSLMIILGDILLTLGVILIVYLVAKKKAGPAPPQRATHGRQTSAPPPPDPDYQSLNPATRSRDVYAEARRK